MKREKKRNEICMVEREKKKEVIMKKERSAERTQKIEVWKGVKKYVSR